MAPKGMKRPASFDVEIGKVKRALLTGDSGATMLAGMCQASLSVPKAERHEFQASTVGMIEEALGLIEASHKNSCDSLETAVDGCPAAKDSRAASVTAAETELASLKKAVKAKKGELDVAVKESEEAVAALKKVKKEQKDGDATLAAVEAKKTNIETTQAESLVPMGEAVAPKDMKALKKVLKLGKDLGLDPTLLGVLPEITKKPKEDRSTFEEASFQSVVGEFAKQVEALAATIADGQHPKAARAEAVAAAAGVVEEAEKKKAAAETALGEAKTAEKAGAAALRAAEKSSTSWLADSKKIMDAYDDAITAQADFASVLTTFAELKELAVAA